MLMDQQKIENHIDALQKRHDKMDEEIQQMEGKPGYANIIVDLKKKKLKLKDEIEKAKTQLV